MTKTLISVLLNEKKINLTAVDVPMAEELVNNLVGPYSGITNRLLIQESCKHEYIWTKVDPSSQPSELSESLLQVCSRLL